MTQRLWIVGIGEDGWDGLSLAARNAIEAAQTLIGSPRQLALVPANDTRRIPWPSPLLPYVDEVLRTYRERRIVVLASGDPMLHGIGAVFASRLAPPELQVIPHVSAFALACARLGWPSENVSLVSLVNRPLSHLHRHLQPECRLIIYSENAATPKAVAQLLRERGYGASELCVLERLGSPLERHYEGLAAAWEAQEHAALNLIALTCHADEGAQALPLVPGLPDDTFETDGQLTKREVRAATLARLAPLPGQLLWDVGAGTGSIGIEWMRVHPSCRCSAFERDAQRAQRILANAHTLGVPDLRVVLGSAPASFAGLEETPEAIFIGGGAGDDALMDACWNALAPGGRMVANAVTLESEAKLIARHARLGGELVRLNISRAEPIGSLLCWRPLMPITQWSAGKIGYKGN